MAIPPAVRPPLLATLLVAALLAVSACMAAPPSGMAAPPSGMAAPVLGPALDADAYLHDAVQLEYHGQSPADLRAQSWAWSEALLNDPERRETLDQICRSSVFLNDEAYKNLASHYDDPVFWTAEVNFARTTSGPATDPAARTSPFVGCVRLHWWLHDRYAPSTRILPTAKATARGVPFLCYRMGIMDGGAITTMRQVTSTIAPIQGTQFEHELWTAEFSPPAYLWCPVDIAASMRAYIYAAHDAAPYAPLDPVFQAEIRAQGPAAANGLLNSVQDYVESLRVTEAADYANFISVAAARRLPAAEGRHPVVDYLTGCDMSERCGLGFRQSLFMGSPASGVYTFTAGFTENGRLLQPSAVAPTPQPRPQRIRFEQCPNNLVDKDVHLLIGNRSPGVGRVADYPSVTMSSSQTDCATVNFASAPNAPTVRIWLGPAHLFIGHTPGADSTFSGSLDFVWFDPDQAGSDPGN